jgi:hypothetical protein
MNKIITLFNTAVVIFTRKNDATSQITIHVAY